MEITGLVTFVGDIASGVSQRGNNWKRQQVEVEYVHGQYPCSIIFDVMDDTIVGKVQQGMEVNVKFDVYTREYNGRRYNEFRIWRDGFHCVSTNAGQSVPAQSQQPVQPQQPTQQPATYAQPQNVQSDNLPF